MNPLLESAIKFSQEKNWHVFPTREKSFIPKKNGEPILLEDGSILVLDTKSPYIKGGFKNATTDINQIKEWWNKFPNAGIGVACGASNLVVVDIDIKGEGKGFDSFIKMGIPDEGALHSATPSGGLHIIYSGVFTSHSNVEKGVDIRAEGGYFIVPPSWIYIDGKKKSYIALDDWTRTPIEFPSNLRERFDFLRYNGKKKEKKDYSNIQIDLKKIKEALDSLPADTADDYFMWIRIGLALKSIGEQGFELWDNWSKQSDKYDRNTSVYKWENFIPKDITIASLFYYAQMLGKKKDE